MSAESVVSIVLGSSVLGTVLGTVLGARLESDKQREEAFRERMVDNAVEFLKAVNECQKTTRAAHAARVRTDSDRDPDSDKDPAEEVLGKAREAVGEAWYFVSVQRVVFPERDVYDAASNLVQSIDDLVKGVARLRTDKDGDRSLSDEYERVQAAHRAYAELANRAIRESAFRAGRPWRRTGFRSAA
jgi:hypothetical protein